MSKDTSGTAGELQETLTAKVYEILHVCLPDNIGNEGLAIPIADRIVEEAMSLFEAERQAVLAAVEDLEDTMRHEVNIRMIDKGMGQADEDDWFNKGARMALDQCTAALRRVGSHKGEE